MFYLPNVKVAHAIKVAFLILISLLQQACTYTQIAPNDLTISNVNLYVGPNQPPLNNASITIRDGLIVGINSTNQQLGTIHIDAKGRTATAGLWNSHVHFTDPLVVSQPQQILTKMLLRYGFTSVVDTGSEPHISLALRQRIEDGQLSGPKIYLAGGSFVYTDGTPAYLPGIKLPELAERQHAAPAVHELLGLGIDHIKIFSGSFQSPTETIHLPANIIRAISDAAHTRNALVIAHPTDRTGLVNAIENGVDILAHSAPPAGPLGEQLTAQMVDNNVAMIPTLMLWSYELRRHGAPKKAINAYQQQGVIQLSEFHRAGGTVLFGTDVGYMRDFDTTEEFTMMQRAGMTFDDILASLTTNPAQRFSDSNGQITLNSPADLVIYQRDPSDDVTAFAEIAYVFRGGELVYEASP